MTVAGTRALAGPRETRDARRPGGPPSKDVREPTVRRIGTAQTFLAAAEIDNLVGDCLAGVGIQELAERCGIRRATVFAHQRRRDTPRRDATRSPRHHIQPGLQTMRSTVMPE